MILDIIQLVILLALVVSVWLTIKSVRAQNALLLAVFDRLNKLEQLENLFLKYEASITIAADAAEKLNVQQERLETLYKFNVKAVNVVQTLAKQRGAR